MSKGPKPPNIAPVSQLELNIERLLEPDRNFSQGGRSFYFFDFDDNVAHLSTATYLFNKKTNEEIVISSAEFAANAKRIGKSGIYKNFKIDINPKTGTYRNFRDKDFNALEKMLGRHQSFVKDVKKGLKEFDFMWKGPCWSCFYHAVFNKRPVSIITARGHAPGTLVRGINEFVKAGHLPYRPNYLSVFPVNHPQTIKDLGGTMEESTAIKKRRAIRASVNDAFSKYGYSKHHRFGMSDDDPQNIELITEEMKELKKEFPDNSFYVISTKKGEFVKREIFNKEIRVNVLPPSEQISLFTGPEL